jgi:hypothetical protein
MCNCLDKFALKEKQIMLEHMGIFEHKSSLMDQQSSLQDMGSYTYYLQNQHMYFEKSGISIHIFSLKRRHKYLQDI